MKSQGINLGDSKEEHKDETGSPRSPDARVGKSLSERV